MLYNEIQAKCSKTEKNESQFEFFHTVKRKGPNRQTTRANSKKKRYVKIINKHGNIKLQPEKMLGINWNFYSPCFSGY